MLWLPMVNESWFFLSICQLFISIKHWILLYNLWTIKEKKNFHQTKYKLNSIPTIYLSIYLYEKRMVNYRNLIISFIFLHHQYFPLYKIIHFIHLLFRDFHSFFSRFHGCQSIVDSGWWFLLKNFLSEYSILNNVQVVCMHVHYSLFIIIIIIIIKKTWSNTMMTMMSFSHHQLVWHIDIIYMNLSWWWWWYYG